VTIYADDNFKGKFKSFESNDDCFANHGWDELISSIKITKKVVT